MLIFENWLLTEAILASQASGYDENVLTRYVLPLMLILGFLSLVAWASRDLMFPPTAVTVVPVFATTAEVRRGRHAAVQGGRLD